MASKSPHHPPLEKCASKPRDSTARSLGWPSSKQWKITAVGGCEDMGTPALVVEGENGTAVDQTGSSSKGEA